MTRTRGTLAFLGTLVLVVAGLVLPGATGAVLLLALAGALVVLLRQTWPHHDPRTRAVRVAILATLVLIAVAKLVG